MIELYALETAYQRSGRLPVLLADEEGELYGGFSINLTLKPLKELSGGEEAKTRLTFSKSNVLVLDESTSHLDKIAKESHKDAILEYPGVILIYISYIGNYIIYV